MRLAEEAVKYAAEGIPVFPVKPLDKMPLTPHGVDDATTALEQIDQWWDRWPDANIATPTGVTVAVDIDIDTSEGINGLTTARELELLFPPTLMQRTPRGGWHLLYRHPTRGMPMHNTQKAIWIDGHKVKAPGIDIRGVGGYILVSPSRTKAGVYIWDKSLADDAVAAPKWLWASEAVPDWVDTAPLSSDDLKGEIRELIEDFESATKGERNALLNVSAYRLGMIAHQIKPEPVLRHLYEAAIAKGLTEREVKATIKSGFEAGRTKGRGN